MTQSARLGDAFACTVYAGGRPSAAHHHTCACTQEGAFFNYCRNRPDIWVWPDFFYYAWPEIAADPWPLLLKNVARVRGPSGCADPCMLGWRGWRGWRWEVSCGAYMTVCCTTVALFPQVVKALPFQQRDKRMVWRGRAWGTYGGECLLFPTLPLSMRVTRRDKELSQTRRTCGTIRQPDRHRRH